MASNVNCGHGTKVSVLVPVYNVERYVAECIESILRQSYTDFELILCDDGSTDHSGVICDEYAKKDPRIRVIHKTNEGLLWTRRVLLHNACGKYVLHVDSDDWIDEKLLETTVNWAEEEDIDVVMFGYRRTTNDGRTIEEKRGFFPDKAIYGDGNCEDVYRCFIGSTKINHLCMKLIKRSLFSEEDERDPLYHRHMNGEDKLQLLPVFARAQRFGYVDQVFYNYRSSTDGMGRNFKISYFSDSLNVQRRTIEFLRQVGIDKQENRQLLYRHQIRSIVSMLKRAVYCGKYTNDELESNYSTVRNDEVVVQALQEVKRIELGLQDRIVLYLFQKEKFDQLITFINGLQWIKQRIGKAGDSLGK